MSPCNTTLEDATIVEEPLYGHFTFHHLGIVLCIVFGLISVIVSLWLMWMHALHYLRPNEQKHIIRILFMIPVYSIVSFLSIVFYRKSVYFDVLMNCYEAFAISSFFSLLCFYIAPSLHEQKDYFRGIKPQNWVFSFFWMQKCTGGENKGPFRKPRSGLTWFNVIWAGIYQYCFIRVFFTIVSVISEATGRYCEASLSPEYAHVWVTAFEAVSVTFAMFFVIQFYIQLKNDLSEHRPFLKVLSIKLVIFFSFWQTILISWLSSGKGPMQPTKKVAYQDIKIGIPSVLLCIEMAFFSVMHIFAYPWKPYSLKHMSSDPVMATGIGYSGGAPRYEGGPLGIKAFMDAANPWDIIKALARGFRWMFVGVKHREEDISYQTAKMNGDNTSYDGPTYAGTGAHATELRPGNEQYGGANGGDGTYDDRTGLLGHSQGPAGREPSPYRTTDDDDMFEGDLSVKHAEADTGYHPGIAPPAAPTGRVQHPAYRPGREDPSAPAAAVQGGPGDWNLWGGAQGEGPRRDDEAGPPPYRF